MLGFHGVGGFGGFDGVGGFDGSYGFGGFRGIAGVDCILRTWWIWCVWWALGIPWIRWDYCICGFGFYGFDGFCLCDCFCYFMACVLLVDFMCLVGLVGFVDNCGCWLVLVVFGWVCWFGGIGRMYWV